MKKDLNFKQKKSKAIKMYISGMNMETICNKLHLSRENLESFLKLKTRNDLKKEIALQMYEKRYFKHDICRELSINNSLLEKWIEDNQKSLKNIYGFPKQNGYGDITTCLPDKKIVKNNVKRKKILYVNLENDDNNFNYLEKLNIKN